MAMCGSVEVNVLRVMSFKFKDGTKAFIIHDTETNENRIESSSEEETAASKIFVNALRFYLSAVGPFSALVIRAKSLYDQAEYLFHHADYVLKGPSEE